MLLIFVLFGMIVFGLFVLFLNLPSNESAEFEDYSANVVSFDVSDGGQFYPNMRYRGNRISYEIEQACDEIKEDEAIGAFGILESRTILEFYPSSSNPELRILCSNVAPEPENEGFFVAGEGGPSKVINSSRYSIILEGKISLFRDSNCEKPQIALHEVLHSLGFDHNNNTASIMYPTTNCQQQLDNYIVEEINRLYSVKSASDLIVSEVNANKTGRYISFDAVVSNIGLKEASSAYLKVYTGGEEAKAFDLENVGIGVRKVLNVHNLRGSKDFNTIRFVVETPDEEITLDNNEVVLNLLENS